MADPVINPVGLKPACQAGTAVPFHFITGMRREREREGEGARDKYRTFFSSAYQLCPHNHRRGIYYK